MCQEEAEQLIIIGNGFDLHCKLNTRFSDYSKYAYSNMPQTEEPLSYSDYKEASPFNKRLTLWDMYFYKLKELRISNWCNFEKQIEVLLNSENVSHDIVNDLSMELDKQFMHIGNPSPIHPFSTRALFSYEDEMKYFGKVDGLHRNSFFNTINDYFIHFILDQDELRDRFISYFENEALERAGEDCEKLLFNILFDELRRFEDNLNSYILNQMKKSNDYSQKFTNTLNNLSDGKKYNLLSFNYTFYPRIVDDDKSITLRDVMDARIEKAGGSKRVFLIDGKPENCVRSVHVHGMVRDIGSHNIVVGIDKGDMQVDDKMFKFTKTYRTFTQNSMDGACLQKGVKEIKIYGHSLSEADYSYFQAIFDFYHIYDSDVKLTVYYTQYTKDKDVELETKQNIIHLLSKYGETLNNKDHGANLMHKLLLEHRLTVKRIN